MGTVPSDADLIRRVVARDDEALMQRHVQRKREWLGRLPPESTAPIQ